MNVGAMLLAFVALIALINAPVAALGNFDFGGGARTITVNAGETTSTNRWDQLTIFGNLTNVALFNGGTMVAEYSDIGGGFPGSGNINADPLWVNPLARDYRLQAGSPALGAGLGGLPACHGCVATALRSVSGHGPRDGAARAHRTGQSGL